MKKFILMAGLIGITAFFLSACDKKSAQYDEHKGHEGHNMSSKKAETEPLTKTAATKKNEYNKNCPVMGDEVDGSLYVEKDGKRINVCCGACIEAVENNFDEYYKKAYGE